LNPHLTREQPAAALTGIIDAADHFHGHTRIKWNMK
jgi:hypothetical protein